MGEQHQFVGTLVYSTDGLFLNGSNSRPFCGTEGGLLKLFVELQSTLGPSCLIGFVSDYEENAIFSRYSKDDECWVYSSADGHRVHFGSRYEVEAGISCLSHDDKIKAILAYRRIMHVGLSEANQWASSLSPDRIPCYGPRDVLSVVGLFGHYGFKCWVYKPGEKDPQEVIGTIVLLNGEITESETAFVGSNTDLAETMDVVVENRIDKEGEQGLKPYQFQASFVSV